MLTDPGLTQQEGQAVNGNSGIGRAHALCTRRESSQPVKAGLEGRLLYFVWLLETMYKYVAAWYMRAATAS